MLGAVAEAPIGYIKEVMRFSTIQLPGLHKAEAVRVLVCLVLNVKRLHTAQTEDGLHAHAGATRAS